MYFYNSIGCGVFSYIQGFTILMFVFNIGKRGLITHKALKHGEKKSMINSKWKSGISGDKNEAIEEEDDNEMHDLSSDSDDDRSFKLPQFVCQICDLECFNEKNLAKHVATHNVKKAKKESKKEIICSDCDIPFTTMKKLLDHHLEDHTCHLRQCDHINTWVLDFT